jgi:serine/threonine-protein phosphatase PPG1|eukprot:gnl/Ergobibamus_cyprinoides/189.p1 GENE.gnl/Ergobibamus_cyprinoides/189~~gnl/Ergobibamus_cyprinoides/189.p1  ORF type:complete len:332 (+),score=52.40 gnl/Ergobibamus_cyprinoides/189:89-1084(+)
MRENLDYLIESLYRGESPSAASLIALCTAVKTVLVEEANIVELHAPISLVGDVHGQFNDVLEIFRIAGVPPHTSFLFLGDYVDRGHYSVETIALLLALKARFPSRVTLLRGNHEARHVCQVYGFWAECCAKFGNGAVWGAVTDAFDFLPLAATIDNEIFCVHGGLSPSMHHLDQVRALVRFAEVPSAGIIADLLWSDPDQTEERTHRFDRSARGIGHIFGHEALHHFLAVNGLRHVVRAHQMCVDGYSLFYNDRLTSLWSAPHYMYRFNNVASVCRVDSTLTRHFDVFGPSPVRITPGQPLPDCEVPGSTASRALLRSSHILTAQMPSGLL